MVLHSRWRSNVQNPPAARHYSIQCIIADVSSQHLELNCAALVLSFRAPAGNIGEENDTSQCVASALRFPTLARTGRCAGLFPAECVPSLPCCVICTGLFACQVHRFSNPIRPRFRIVSLLFSNTSCREDIYISNEIIIPAMTDVREALDRARNSTDGRIDSQTGAVLEKAIQELWSRIQAQPTSYILNRDEFALFNYFRERFKSSVVAQKAVERFWNNFQGDSAGIGRGRTA
ncbi:hypothetical protein BGW36DRAFT_34042 [Talaromyces proteolyticus]|uniref:Uncharacterized protein n=1 Tax=Talaromyces proteolyticus TaxID=1131652 RepID=A0AAD4PXT2_9EURO|nr:uncharacterized protein BGW36DRAFT_34042 [Talaromyces proteolyticus]KAH8693093.1 hypothetical protein BGW36DRAFT_34042 [Talaromyces proteolyticus]